MNIQILKTDLHTFHKRISDKNLLKDQSTFPLVIVLLILTPFSLDNTLMLQGEN